MSGGREKALTAPQLSGIRRLTALETVRARIALAVELGLLAPGEWLPASDKIAAALDVGEITARRALVSLCEDGVLERIRGRGGGTRVAEHPVRAAVSATATYESSADEVRALIDHRLVLECGLAHLAAQRSDESTMDELRRLVDEMDRAESWAEFHRHDEAFHLAVARLAGVDVEPYRRALHDLYRFYLPYPLGHLQDSNADHRTLVEALAARDPLRATETAHNHVATLHSTMFIALNRAAD